MLLHSQGLKTPGMLQLCSAEPAFLFHLVQEHSNSGAFSLGTLGQQICKGSLWFQVVFYAGRSSTTGMCWNLQKKLPAIFFLLVSAGGSSSFVPSSSSLTSQWESTDFHQGAFSTWLLELTPASIWMWNHRPSESLGCPPG